MPLDPLHQAPKPLNGWILNEIRDFPEGGGYRFSPSWRAANDPTNPRDPEYDGVLRSLTVQSKVVARASSDGATYCCGVTLEAYWRAYQRAAADPQAVPGGLGAAQAEQFIALWFCPEMGSSGPSEALVGFGLGDAIGAQEAQPGDLVQFWRSTHLSHPSGHSAIFLGWEPGGGIRYWSSQPATGGVNVHVEVPQAQWTFSFARAHAPSRS